MSENECESKCESKCNSKCNSTCSSVCNIKSKEFPVVIGGIVVYELAIIIVLLILIIFSFDEPCEKPNSITTEPDKASAEE